MLCLYNITTSKVTSPYTYFVLKTHRGERIDMYRANAHKLKFMKPKLLSVNLKSKSNPGK